jgi:hypothetical protein
LATGHRWHKCQNSLTIGPIHCFFAVLISRLFIGRGTKPRAEPKVGRSQNGTASNRENLPENSLTLASAILERIKGVEVAVGKALLGRVADPGTLESLRLK